MSILERNNPILHELNNKLIPQDRRTYLGLSSSGDKCLRRLQFSHYWVMDKFISARIERLFNVGHAAEDIIIADLAKVGITVTDEQKEIIGVTGHWKGHIDGIGHTNSKSFLVEFKTHNDKSFADMKKKKVQESKPTHYGQMQAYMDGLKLDEALYVAVNKNTSEYYIEWVPHDPEYCTELTHKQLEVVLADALLPRIGNNSATWFQCKMCDYKRVCFGKQEVKETCRSCAHVDILDNGIWACGKTGKKLTKEEQLAACKHYNLIAMLKV